MASDFEIGRVVAVDTGEVTVELNKDLKALTRSTYEDTFEVGRINSYVIVPVGARRVVAMITRVVLMEESELKADKTMVTLPSSRRLMKATMIGTIDEGEFHQGISLFPVLDSPVLLLTRDDLDAIFGRKDEQAGESAAPDSKGLRAEGTAVETKKEEAGEIGDGPAPKAPGYCIPIGHSAVFPDYDILIDPDAFFGKHAAVIGSTGSGKSCSIATILQSILERDEVLQTRIIILDTNGEYRASFPPESFKSLHIPTNPRDRDHLTIPYWFMNAEDFVRLFQASKGVQRPVLLDALRIARNQGAPRDSCLVLREELVLECGRILAASNREDKSSKDVRDFAEGLLKRVQDDDVQSVLLDLKSRYGVEESSIVEMATEVKKTAEKHIDKVGTTEYPKVVPADARHAIEEVVNSLYEKLMLARDSDVPARAAQSPDTPVHFSKWQFRTRHIEQVLRREESGGPRARDYAGTMLLRIDRLLADTRFEFLMGPCDGEFPRAEHALATFLRDILGLASCGKPNPPLSLESPLPKGVFPFYDRQRAAAKRSNVVVVDLSLLASEVLENVTALIGRLVLEFLQRLGDPISGVERGGFPVVMVLEEAQNYVRESRKTDEEESISKLVFERIAREGRKFGLGLVVASQRPSELSKTMLSQCNSFIVHRLQNPEDLRYFRETVPTIYGQLLGQLPALAQRHALVLGECVRAPVVVEMREANPVPRSKDPRFWGSWTNLDPKTPDVEAVCAKWEGNTDGASSHLENEGSAMPDNTANIVPDDTIDADSAQLPDIPFDR